MEKTGQTLCFDDIGDEISCAGTGQDGELQMGIEWPKLRFLVNGDGTVRDRLTGLTWLQDAGCFTPAPWEVQLQEVEQLNSGLVSCENYTSGTFSDWRMPNIKELLSLIDYSVASGPRLPPGNPFLNAGAESFFFWTSTAEQGLPDRAYRITLDQIEVRGNVKGGIMHVWPVRGDTSALVFIDGFESGDTSAWSNTVGSTNPGQIFFITLQVSPGSVPRTGGLLNLSALVRDNLGFGVPNAPVAFNTEAGTLDSGGAIVLTSSDGIALDGLTMTSGDIDALGSRTFDVRASTVDFSGSLIQSEFMVNVQVGAPVADFDFFVNGLTVTFQNQSTGDPPLACSWDFGDGSSSSICDPPPKVYGTPNTYNVRLSATNSVGTDSIFKPVTVTQ